MTDVSQLPIEDEAEAAEPQAADERRSRSDRRSGGDPGRRGRPTKQHSFLRATVRDVIAIALLVTAIVLTVSVVRPIYSAKGPVAQQILQGAVQPGVQTPPADTSIEARAIASPGFEADRKAFAADLVRTGRVPQDRADTIAFYAVREAYIRGIPPAVIFGVMLTENAVFVSNATSNV